MIRKKEILFLMLLLFSVLPVAAQEKKSRFRVPFDFELLLSGNFGELRSNHFHSGLDFKTQGVVGKPIKCVADGYISRATVQSDGYGLALYVVHDNGYMTVYGHLDRFPDGVARRVRDYQYRNETFVADISFAPGEFRVKEGELLAYAGNTGYSFGPHLHFEVRNSAGNEWYDPMLFYKESLKDTRAPQASAFVVYPSAGSGVVKGASASRVLSVKGGAVADTLDVWGWVALGVKALDYMDGTNNKYGVYGIDLKVDGQQRFSSTMGRFSSEENRLINSWADYPRYVNDGEWFQRMYIMENNPLKALKADDDNGWICVDEERLYKVECRLRDYHGNSTGYVFYLRGRQQEILAPKGEVVRLNWFVDNAIECGGMRIDIPAGELFENMMLDVGSTKGKYGVSERYSLGEKPVPLWHGATLKLKVNEGAVADKSKLYIESFTKKGRSAIIAEYKDGCMVATVKALTGFEVAVDTVPPSLTPVKENAWQRNGKVVFSVGDKQTSVKSFKGTLDGKFVLFSYSSKNGSLELDLKRENVSRGEHLLRVEVVDACGNSSAYEKKIRY